MTPVTHILYQWYAQHQRELPWRNTRDPYAIWLSEVILQQTRIDQGTAYYERFIRRWPDVQSLANASEQEVLKEWQGLGYYSRARNLLAAARDICSHHNGVFPDQYDQIKKLKGVGPYTAAAVGSIAFNLPYAVADGNVMRFIARLYGITEAIDTTMGRKKIEAMADVLLDRKNPGMHNQAMMEFGALQCVPGKPDCLQCPLAQFCVAHEKQMVEVLPAKSKKIQTKTRWFHYLICTSDDTVLLHRRTKNDIWKGLFEFPLVETAKETEPDFILSHPLLKELTQGKPFTLKKISPLYQHQLTHQRIMARFFHLQFAHSLVVPQKIALSLINLNQFHEFPLPRLIDRYLQENSLD